MTARYLPLLVLAGCSSLPVFDAPERPNFVIVFTDDQGYGDLSCYGNPTIHTPHIDALAESGAKLTQFYVPSPVCSPSRAALLTGCYPKRVTMHKHVIFPEYDYGLHTDEETLADLLSEAGYATGCFGKWHLGHRPGLMPLDQGFDVYAGVPYSNDMAQIHRKPESTYPYHLPWIEGNEVIEWEPDQSLLTRRTTDHAIEFIEEHAGERPFFAYVPHSMPHIPIYASEEYRGKSPRGLYGDVIEEIDGSVGDIVAALERTGVRENTVVLFLTDNGPWKSYKRQGGSSGPLRAGKGTTWEGGQRVPSIWSYPAGIKPRSVLREVATSMDVAPTFLELAGARSPERVIDGRNISSYLLRGEAPDPEPFLYYTSKGELDGIRVNEWKLLLRDEPKLFHLLEDIGEEWDVAKHHTERVATMTALAHELDAAIEMRPTLTVEEFLFHPEGPDYTPEEE